MPVDDKSPSSLLTKASDYPLHLLGWKAFQDLCIAVAEECLRRPVQSFLPSKDAGRDGAFVGRWEGTDQAAGESTIQCKFTSKPDNNLSLSMLSDELKKASDLATSGLAMDYIILTNHPITGKSELQIKDAFQKAGVGRCRTFGYDWIMQQIRASPRLRMMAPRLYGLGDLSDLLDTRAYGQAQMILSAMGDDLKKLVVTEAHRKSVRAICNHNLVLLLGAPATGKSTIGASLAIGAADIWQCGTIRVTSPQEIRQHVNPGMPQQFFWIDDAWGNTQYQRQTAEEWNQVFPLMQGAIKAGTRFLITSRDYIWNAAQEDLKLQTLPVLKRSQVIINVQELSTQEKAQILYNHLKLGDQPLAFRAAVKPYLPEMAERKDFLPETARRLGSVFFAGDLDTSPSVLTKFFEKPAQFLHDTIVNLAPDCRAAIAVVFLNHGTIRSPIAIPDLEYAASAFGTIPGDVRVQVEALNGSLLLLATDESGPYWTYKHPTVGDAFATYVAGSPELVEIYLRGAKPTSIIYEVVCGGAHVSGAPVVVPDSLHSLLADRIESLHSIYLVSFLSYRSNKTFSALMLERRPDILDRLRSFSSPIKEDTDASLVATLHGQGLLPEDIRLTFVEAVRTAAVDDADSSFLDSHTLQSVLTDSEKHDILLDVELNLFPNIAVHVSRLRDEWDKNSEPEEYFEEFGDAIKRFADELRAGTSKQDILEDVRTKVREAVAIMNADYEPSPSTSAPTSLSPTRSTPLTNLFRDIDE